MSYDLRVGVRASIPNLSGDDFVMIREPEYANPTYNLGDMFRASTGWNYKQGVAYHVPEVLPLIKKGIYELICNEHAYDVYKPANGWGTIQNARDTLQSLHDCIMECAEDWPMEALWVKW